MNRLAQDEFIRSCARYGGAALVALATLEHMESQLLDYKDASGFTLRHGILLNKQQLESAFAIFHAGDDLIDMKAFLDRIKAEDAVPGTVYSSYPAESPHRYGNVGRGRVWCSMPTAMCVEFALLSTGILPGFQLIPASRPSSTDLQFGTTLRPPAMGLARSAGSGRERGAARPPRQGGLRKGGAVV
jgi:hypothetical protein